MKNQKLIKSETEMKTDELLVLIVANIIVSKNIYKSEKEAKKEIKDLIKQNLNENDIKIETLDNYFIKIRELAYEDGYYNTKL